MSNPVITTSSPLPDGTVGTAYHKVMAATGGSLPYLWDVYAGALPPGLSLSSAGLISGTPTTTGIYTLGIEVTDSGAGLTGDASFTLTVVTSGGGTPPTITTSSLPGVFTGSVYSQAIAVTGGTAPLSFAITSGALPTGLTINTSTGVISGTPSVAGTAIFDVTVTDAASLTSVASLSIVVATPGSPPAIPPSITTPSMPFGTVGAAYTQTLAVVGGTSPFTFSISSGALPAGLSLNTSTGVIAGTPTAAATSTFTVLVTDSASLTGSTAFSLVVSAALPTVPAAFSSGVVNPMRASGGMPPVCLLEVVTAANGYYAWSERDLANGNAIMSQNTTPIATITPERRLIVGFTAVYPSFIVVLTHPAPIAPGEPVTIAGNTFTPANGNWTIGDVLGPDTYRVYQTTTAGSGTGGTSSTAGGSSVDYKGWIVGQPRFSLTGTTQTNTGSIDIQNYSGNTVMRDVATAFTREEFIGAFIYFRLWRADAEVAVFTFMGTVSDVDLTDDRMSLSLEGFGNWSACVAPSGDIDATCPLFFGSVECGSTSLTPCQFTFGSCTSIERFKGVITQYDYANNGATLTQIAQPAPIIVHNPARAF